MDALRVFSAFDRELEGLAQGLRGSLTHLAWQLSLVPGRAFVRVYVSDDASALAREGYHWRREDGLAYA